MKFIPKHRSAVIEQLSKEAYHLPPALVFSAFCPAVPFCFLYKDFYAFHLTFFLNKYANGIGKELFIHLIF